MSGLICERLKLIGSFKVWLHEYTQVLVTVRNKLMPVFGDIENKALNDGFMDYVIQNPTPVTAQSPVTMDVIILFIEHNNPQYFSEGKEQTWPALVQFAEQNSTSLFFYWKKPEGNTH